MASDEELRLRATLVDQASGPLRALERSFEDFRSGGGAPQALAADFGAAHKAASEFGNVVRSGLSPLLGGIGIAGLGASAAVGALAKTFDESARSINKMQYEARDLGTTTDFLYRLAKSAQQLGLEAPNLELFATNLQLIKQSVTGMEMEFRKAGTLGSTAFDNINRIMNDKSLDEKSKLQSSLEEVVGLIKTMSDPAQQNLFARKFLGVSAAELIAVLDNLKNVHHLTQQMEDDAKAYVTLIGQLKKKWRDAPDAVGAYVLKFPTTPGGIINKIGKDLGNLKTSDIMNALDPKLGEQFPAGSAAGNRTIKESLEKLDEHMLKALKIIADKLSGGAGMGNPNNYLSPMAYHPANTAMDPFASSSGAAPFQSGGGYNVLQPGPGGVGAGPSGSGGGYGPTFRHGIGPGTRGGGGEFGRGPSDGNYGPTNVETGPGVANVRTNNPGAMNIGPDAMKYGAVGSQTIGGGNKIAVFPNPVQGAAANMETIRRYATSGYPTIGQMISHWSGGGRGSVGDPAYPQDMELTPDRLNDPKFMSGLVRAIARGEGPGKYPIDDQQLEQAFGIYQSGKDKGREPGAGIPPGFAAKGRGAPIGAHEQAIETAPPRGHSSGKALTDILDRAMAAKRRTSMNGGVTVDVNAPPGTKVETTGAAFKGAKVRRWIHRHGHTMPSADANDAVDY